MEMSGKRRRDLVAEPPDPWDVEPIDLELGELPEMAVRHLMN